MKTTLPFSVHSGGLEKTMEFLLNTGSTIDEGRLAKGGCKLTDEYTEECAVCNMNPQDYRQLGSPGNVKVIAGDGKHSVAVYAHPDDSVPRGQVFMPRAIWSNVVVDPETFSTGSPLYKGSPVRIEPTGDDVLSAEALVLKLYRRM
ncbi:MAG TPA: molybdopterin dinucleotide binding domain-containing protein [Methanothrix sp.]|nr:molybdopterin dinucleotide binding domain-containing protein [Methanothrix sp.]